ncbi:hypothetical protein GQR58_015043 [Nymphon striatum]|nr:hypothetical protein GQR58_015043 [Nymphon striatum]
MSVKCASRLMSPQQLLNQVDTNRETKEPILIHSRLNSSDIPEVKSPCVDDSGNSVTLSVLQDVAQAVKKVPFADPEEVKSLLEDNSNFINPSLNSDKLALKNSSLLPNWTIGASHAVCDFHQTDDPLKISESDSVQHQLMIDVKEIMRIFPNQDQYEIYAYLEAHFHKENRVQIVVDELLSMMHSSQESSLRNSPTDMITGVNSFSDPFDVKHAIQSLSSIFPRADAKALESALEGYERNPERIQSLAADLFQISMLPKLRESLKVKLELLLQKVRAPETFLVSAFLEFFDNPEEYFYDESKPVSDCYRINAISSLRELFVHFPMERIEEVLKNHRLHYTPALRQLEYEQHLVEQTIQVQTYLITGKSLFLNHEFKLLRGPAVITTVLKWVSRSQSIGIPLEVQFRLLKTFSKQAYHPAFPEESSGSLVRSVRPTGQTG